MSDVFNSLQAGHVIELAEKIDATTGDIPHIDCTGCSGVDKWLSG